MTTCDATWKERGGSTRYEVSNGLGGPATGLMHRIAQAVAAGELVGRADEASADAECTGEWLLAVLSPSIERGYWAIDGRGAPAAEVLSALKPEAVYVVDCLEV